MHLFTQVVWRNMQRITLEKSRTNVANVTMLLSRRRQFDKTFENSHWRGPTNVAYVTMHLLRPAIWGDIWKFTRIIWKLALERNRTNATSVTMHFLMQVIWGDIWKSTQEKNLSNAANVTMHPTGKTLWGRMWQSTLVNDTLDEPSRQFEENFQNSHCREIAPMQPM